MQDCVFRLRIRSLFRRRSWTYRLRVRQAENNHQNFDDNDAAGNDSLPIQLEAKGTRQRGTIQATTYIPSGQDLLETWKPELPAIQRPRDSRPTHRARLPDQRRFRRCLNASVAQARIKAILSGS
jgi:hypothetical protein